jgi:hypothetical protein
VLGLSFSVKNFDTTILDQSFTSLTSADSYFTDHALNLGTFSGNTRLTLTFALNSSAANQGADFSYLLASGPLTVASVPEPEQFVLLLAGLGLMGLVSRRRSTRKENA